MSGMARGKGVPPIDAVTLVDTGLFLIIPSFKWALPGRVRYTTMTESKPGSRADSPKPSPSSRAGDACNGAQDDDVTNEKEATDPKLTHGGARRGFAGKLESSRATAPEGATQGDIQDVAWVAWDTDRDPADVWREVAQ